MRGATRAPIGASTCVVTSRPFGSADDRSALFTHELRHVPGAQTALAGGAARLPAAERLCAGPGSGRRSGTAVDGEDARPPLLPEALPLPVLPPEDARRQPPPGRVRPCEPP